MVMKLTPSLEETTVQGMLLLMVCDSCESLEPVGAPDVVSPIAIWGTL